MTSHGLKPASRSHSRLRWTAFGLFVALMAVTVMACGTALAADPTSSAPATAAVTAQASPALTQGPSTSPSHSPTPEPQPLRPASPSADPLAFMAYLFTPIFQGLFILLASLYALTGNILVAILLMTLLIRILTMRLSARQIVSQVRMQRIAPEMKALQDEIKRKYRGDRQAVFAATQEATQAFYKERGVSPTAGCLPSLLQMGLLIPMYSVIRDGLTSYDPKAMLQVFGVNLVPNLTCTNVVNEVVQKSKPCIQVVVGGIDWSQPQVLFNLPILTFSLGISALALVAAALQFVQSRMLMPPAIEDDPSSSSQRTMMVLFPFLSVLYGGILPAGLFIYWIGTSAFSIVQQFLFVGWGNMFPLLGWHPSFARTMTPRFPVTMPEPDPTRANVSGPRRTGVERYTKVAPPTRPSTQRRSSRRGRRR